MKFLIIMSQPNNFVGDNDGKWFQGIWEGHKSIVLKSKQNVASEVKISRFLSKSLLIYIRKRDLQWIVERHTIISTIIFRFFHATEKCF